MLFHVNSRWKPSFKDGITLPKTFVACAKSHQIYTCFINQGVNSYCITVATVFLFN